MAMTSKNKVLAGTAALVAASCLFPPWHVLPGVEARTEVRGQHRGLGWVEYGLLFAPPEGGFRFGTTIVYERLALQVGAIIALGGLGLLLTRERKALVAGPSLIALGYFPFFEYLSETAVLFYSCFLSRCNTNSKER